MKLRTAAPLAAAAALLAASPHGPVETDRWAVIVGVSDYANFGDEVGGDLPGATRDARNVRDVLVARWGFEPDRIRMLLDGDATREGIRAALAEWLPSVVEPGDLALFYFAGHGSQAWDEDGDEADGLDETICPVDVLKGSSENDIADDELGAWLRALPTDNVVVVYDKCYAESSSRAATPFARPRSLARDPRADLPAPPGTRAVAAGAADAPSVTDSPGDRVLEIAASQDDEVAVDAVWPAEDGETYGGAFTTLLVRNLWRVPPGTTYEEAFALTAEDLRRNRFAQRPQLTASAGARSLGLFEVFGAPGSGSGTAGAGLPAEPAGAGVRLAAGAAAGVTVGSVYRVGDGLFRVDRVEDGAATAAPLAGVRAPAGPAAAELVAYAAPEPVLRVGVGDLAAESRRGLKAAAGDVPGLAFVEDRRAFAELLVRPGETGWVVLGLDGAIRHSARGGADGLRELAAALAKEAGAHRLAALENPAYPFPLEFGLVGGGQRFRLGEPIEFRARSGRAGYLTLVDLGTDGTITVLHPLEGAGDGRVEAGAEIRIPAPDGDIVFRAVEPPGRGIVRAFVTPRPLGLALAGDDASAAARVAEALRAAAGVAPAGAPGAVPVDGWATASVVYEIAR